MSREQRALDSAQRSTDGGGSGGRGQGCTCQKQTRTEQGGPGEAGGTPGESEVTEVGGRWRGESELQGPPGSTPQVLSGLIKSSLSRCRGSSE